MTYEMRDALVCEISRLTLDNQKFSREQLAKKIKLIWEYLPELPKPAKITTNIMQDPWLTYPYDKHLIMTLIDIFESNGWVTTWQTRESDVDSNGIMNRNPTIRFDYPNFSISAICEFNDKLIGSTCTRKVIGKKLVEKDIVEFTCDETNN